MEAEFRRIQAITNRAERLAEIIVQELADHVLTLKCPCGAAFVDFDGCFALTCSRCHQPFCAWCLQRSPGEIHHHVQTCPRNPGNTYYGTQQEFNQFHAERKRRLVQERIEREEEEVKEKVMQRLVEQLRA